MTLTENRPGVADLTFDTSPVLAPDEDSVLAPESPTEVVIYRTPLPPKPERGFIYGDWPTNEVLEKAAVRLGKLGLGANITAYRPNDAEATIDDGSGERSEFVGLLTDLIASDDYANVMLELEINHTDHKHVRDLIPEATLVMLGVGAQVNRASRNGKRLKREKVLGSEYYLG
jgi:hypothetical protein